MLFNATGGEIVEFLKYWFTVRDETNGLSVLYLMTAGGLGTPSPLPGSFSYGGQTTPFTTKFPVRVTGFISCQIIGATPPAQPTDVVPQLKFSFGVITMQYRSDDSGVHTAGPKSIDTGKISVPGLSGQTGPWKIVSVCHGGPGATRHVITENDLVFE